MVAEERTQMGKRIIGLSRRLIAGFRVVYGTQTELHSFRFT
jgi:hypothetical protein